MNVKPLAEQELVTCQRDAQKLSQDAIQELLPELVSWQVVEHHETPQLRRLFQFKNFGQALLFTNQIGLLAEQYNHHPCLVTQWGEVEVGWWTHKIKGLHYNDFVMAAKTQRLFSNFEGL